MPPPITTIDLGAGEAAFIVKDEDFVKLETSIDAVVNRGENFMMICFEMKFPCYIV